MIATALLGWALTLSALCCLFSVKVFLLVLLFGQQEVPDVFHVNWCQKLNGALQGPIVQDLSGGRHVGPNWV